ncbi:MAG TPA: hypothetical protein VHD35_03205 [Chitinophagaceae bacterium]|nr:hypothetical protein [Chitinophagaceae bacterium]HVZ96300.1 hypothetical protein [Chitinophagaceae bacterium]
MKQFLILLAFASAVYTSYSQDSSGLSYSFKEAGISIKLPNSKWYLADSEENNSRAVYIFKREAITDNSNTHVIPNIAVIIEDVDENTDVIEYSIVKRTKTPFDVSETFIHGDGKINYENAVGYKGSYTDQRSILHTIYVVHAINKNKGIQLILDTTSETFAEIDREFLAVLKSLK